MKITKSQLKRVIQEELENVLNESPLDQAPAIDQQMDKQLNAIFDDNEAVNVQTLVRMAKTPDKLGAIIEKLLKQLFGQEGKALEATPELEALYDKAAPRLLAFAKTAIALGLNKTGVSLPGSLGDMQRVRQANPKTVRSPIDQDRDTQRLRNAMAARSNKISNEPVD